MSDPAGWLVAVQCNHLCGDVVIGVGVQGTGAAYCQCLQPFSNPPFSVNHTQACQLGETQLFANTCPGWNAEFGVPCNGHGQAQVFEEGDCTCYCNAGYDSPNCTLVCAQLHGPLRVRVRVLTTVLLAVDQPGHSARQFSHVLNASPLR